MKYKISDVSVMAGVSSETLRRYEKQGIIRSQREENGYRTYEAIDLAVLIRVKMYRNLGFSLKEVSALFEGELQVKDPYFIHQKRSFNKKYSCFNSKRKRFSFKLMPCDLRMSKSGL